MTKENQVGVDIVLVILDLVKGRVQLTEEDAQQIEHEVRSRHGGQYTRIAKRKPHPGAEQRRKIKLEMLGDASDEEIQRSNAISRATLYRYQKRDDEGTR